MHELKKKYFAVWTSLLVNKSILLYISVSETRKKLVKNRKDRQEQFKCLFKTSLHTNVVNLFVPKILAFYHDTKYTKAIEHESHE